MTDLEMTRLCAQAMGYQVWTGSSPAVGFIFSRIAQDTSTCTPYNEVFSYEPLKNDAQAMALVKRFRLEIFYENEHPQNPWCIYHADRYEDNQSAMNADLNRAICECCANKWLYSQGGKNANAADKNQNRR